MIQLYGLGLDDKIREQNEIPDRAPFMVKVNTASFLGLFLVCKRWPNDRIPSMFKPSKELIYELGTFGFVGFVMARLRHPHHGNGKVYVHIRSLQQAEPTMGPR